VSLLYFTKITSGRWVSGPIEIRRSAYSRQWLVRQGDHLLGFRPTLAEAKRLAERNTSRISKADRGGGDRAQAMPFVDPGEEKGASAPKGGFAKSSSGDASASQRRGAA
jgi:hypothetical protein